MLRRKRFWLGLIITVIFLGIFIARTDFDEIHDAFSSADYALALAAVPLYFIGFWIRTIRWRLLLSPVRRVSTLRLYPVVLIGLMTNNVAPLRVGELVRAYLVGERESLSKSTALGTIAVDRTFDGLTLVMMLGIVAALSGSNGGVKGVGIFTAVSFLCASLVLVSLALSPQRARPILSRLVNLFPAPLAEKIESLIDSFSSGLQAIRSPRTLAIAAVASVSSWLVEGSMYYIVGQAFDLDVGFEVYLLVLAGANLALSIFASPGGIGPFEATTQAVLLSFSVPVGQAFAYAVDAHLLQHLPLPPGARDRGVGAGTLRIGQQPGPHRREKELGSGAARPAGRVGQDQVPRARHQGPR
ncbi:MAG: flippase-like domain-containing protein [Dehalococcoidia bacterium]|nr:flippase-like domain-containing protein [Dehalococcoidia bacterium]